MGQTQTASAPQTLPADFFEQKKKDAPDTLPADFDQFDKTAETLALLSDKGKSTPHAAAKTRNPLTDAVSMKNNAEYAYPEAYPENMPFVAPHTAFGELSSMARSDANQIDRNARVTGKTPTTAEKLKRTGLRAASSAAKIPEGMLSPKGIAIAAGTVVAPEVTLPYLGYEGAKAMTAPDQEGEDAWDKWERRTMGGLQVAGAGYGAIETGLQTPGAPKPLTQRIVDYAEDRPLRLEKKGTENITKALATPAGKAGERAAKMDKAIQDTKSELAQLQRNSPTKNKGAESFHEVAEKIRTRQDELWDAHKDVIGRHADAEVNVDAARNAARSVLTDEARAANESEVAATEKWLDSPALAKIKTASQVDGLIREINGDLRGKNVLAYGPLQVRARQLLVKQLRSELETTLGNFGEAGVKEVNRRWGALDEVADRLEERAVQIANKEAKKGIVPEWAHTLAILHPNPASMSVGAGISLAKLFNPSASGQLTRGMRSLSKTPLSAGLPEAPALNYESAFGYQAPTPLGQSRFPFEQGTEEQASLFDFPQTPRTELEYSKPEIMRLNMKLEEQQDILRDVDATAREKAIAKTKLNSTLLSLEQLRGGKTSFPQNVRSIYEGAFSPLDTESLRGARKPPVTEFPVPERSLSERISDRLKKPFDKNPEKGALKFGIDRKPRFVKEQAQSLADKLNERAPDSKLTIIGSIAKKGKGNDIDLLAEKYTPEIQAHMEELGYTFRGSSVVSPKEAAKSNKNFGSGWSRIQHFEDASGRKSVDIFHPLPDLSKEKGALKAGKKKQEVKVFHGTSEKFDSFSNDMKGSITGSKSAKGAIWFTDDEHTARAYSVYASETGPINKALAEADRLEKIAQRSGKNSDWEKAHAAAQKAEDLDTYDANAQRRKDNAQVKEATVSGDFLEVDAKGKTPQELSKDGDIDSWLDEQLKRGKRMGKDGVVFKNLDDAVGLYNHPATHYAIFDAKNIKSKKGK